MVIDVIDEDNDAVCGVGAAGFGFVFSAETAAADGSVALAAAVPPEPVSAMDCALPIAC